MTAKTERAAPNLNSLTGAEKVAVLLLALGKTKAAHILRRFDADELKLITRSAADLTTITAADLDALVEEFAKKFATGIKFIGTAKELENLLVAVMTEDEIAEVKSGGERTKEEPVWEIVSRLKEDVLRACLTKEHPQTAALILSRIDSGTAAKIVGGYPAAQRNDLLCRMLVMSSVSEESIAIVENMLREELTASQGNSLADAHTNIANILNKLDKTQSDDVLQSMSALRPDDAELVKGMLFSFDDLVTLSPSVRTMVFDQVPIERVVLSLKGLDAQFQATILSSLASRSRRMVEAELQNGNSGSARDVTEARRLIVDIVLRMVTNGEIDLKAPGGGGEEAA
ncbi:MAG: FliG C-terminal domain-containing protein [Hyphomicrobiaceae bacterium]